MVSELYLHIYSKVKSSSIDTCAKNMTQVCKLKIFISQNMGQIKELMALTPVRTPRISGLKTQVLQPRFLA